MSDQNDQSFAVPPPDLPSEGASISQREPSAESRAERERAGGLGDLRIRGAQEAVSAALLADAPRRNGGEGPRPADALLGVGNIQGVGAGISAPGDEGTPGKEVLCVGVAEPMSARKVRELLVDGFAVRAAGDVPLRVVHTGLIRLQSHTHRQRRAPGGISVGHHTGVQGTLGFFAKGRTAPDTDKLFLVSANHVIANINSAAIGSCIVQPAPADGGRCPADRIALLHRMVELDFFYNSNWADCASAWCYPDEVVTSQLQIHYVFDQGYQLFSIGSVPQFPVLNTWVAKSGAVTQLTSGWIDNPYWDTYVTVSENPLQTLFFRGQMLIHSYLVPFSTHGDSGAVVWTYDASANPVGLLIGGSSAVSVATPIHWVLDFLSLNLL